MPGSSLARLGVRVSGDDLGEAPEVPVRGPDDADTVLAYEHGDRTVRAFLERASRTGIDVRTTTGALAQHSRETFMAPRGVS